MAATAETPGTATAINNGGSITTSGDEAFGIAAQADGGNGGNGGEATDASRAYGGTGGGGGNAGTAVATNNGGTITTNGSFSYGILSRAAGGKGGFGAVGRGTLR